MSYPKNTSECILYLYPNTVFEEDWIVDKVKGLKGTYTNPQDWDEEPPRSEYN